MELFNKEAEFNTVAHAIADRDSLLAVLDELVPADFYEPSLRLIIDVVFYLDREGKSIDKITILDELVGRKQLNEKIEAGVESLFSQEPSSDIKDLVNIVGRDSTRRRALAGAVELQTLARSETDRDKIVARANQFAMSLVQSGGSGPTPVGLTAGELYDDIEFWANNPLPVGEVRGIATGIPRLDRLLDGMERGESIIICARPSMGKCLGRGTKILMHDGSLLAVENIKAGDKLMGPDSNSRTVLGTTVGRSMMYRVKQTHGIDYRVNGDHILSLKRSKSKEWPGSKYEKGDVKNVAVSEFDSVDKSRWAGYKVAVDFQERPIPIDPYFLGIWLGDGTTSGSSITTPEKEIIDFLHQYADERGEYITSYLNTSGCPSLRITGGRSQAARRKSIQATLNEMGLLGDKHIPHEYLINSKRIRLQLLAGFLDTDGYYPKLHNGPYEIVQKREVLIKQLKFLCDTLGYRTTVTTKRAICNGKDCGIFYRLRFNGNVDEIPVKVKRKKARPFTSNKNWRLSRIAVEEEDVDDYYGFMLDGDGLFLLEDMTVTHNSALAFEIMLRVGQAGHSCLGFALEMQKKQIVARWAMSRSGVQTSRVRHGVSERDLGWYVSGEELQRYIAAVTEISRISNIVIDDTASLTIQQIRARAIRVARDLGGLDLLVVDHGALIDASPVPGENSAQTEGRKARGIRTLAKELNCVALIVWQLRRFPEIRPPKMEDLRGSGELEQDADRVLGLYRDEYNNQQTDRPNQLDILALKQREGARHLRAVVRFEAEFMRFTELTTQLPTSLDY